MANGAGKVGNQGMTADQAKEMRELQERSDARFAQSQRMEQLREENAHRMNQLQAESAIMQKADQVFNQIANAISK